MESAGLAWSALCYTAGHRSITGAHRCTLIYLIIIGGCADLYSVRRGGGISGIGGGAALDGMPSGVAQAVYRQLV